MNGARLTVVGAMIIVIGSVMNAITVHQPPAVIGCLLALVAARWLIINAAKRKDAWADRIVRVLHLR